MTDLIKAISDIVAEPARNYADGCFAADDIESYCDDTACWCRDYCDDKAREIIELVRKHDRANQWQPIETAPVGERFLSAYPLMDDHWSIRIGVKNDDGVVTSTGATHWMSLPEGPGE